MLFRSVASTTTSDSGTYSISVPSNQNIYVRARAEINRAGSPAWRVGVTDNTQGDGLYVLDSSTFLLDANGATRDLHAASGWGGSSYTGARDAAPFAILDTVYEAMQFVLATKPGLNFPTLRIHWSGRNTTSIGTSGPVASTGQIGWSQFDVGTGMYLLGAENTDTDEYDRNVITQLWGQYLLASFGRDDGASAPHAPGDQLDLRVAFREGFGNAIAAIVAGDSVFRNTQGTQQAQGTAFDVEGDATANPSPGWFSERSIHELIYNVYDSHPNTVPAGSSTQDNVALGFGPLYDAMSGALRSTTAQTSIFPFINALEKAVPASQADIDALVRAQGMSSIVDDYGTTETHFGTPPSARLVSVYDAVVVNGGATSVCSVDDFKSTTSGVADKLGTRRYVRFSVATSGTYTLRATAVTPPAAADPDLILHQAGTIGTAQNAPTSACTQSWQTSAGVCSESRTASLSPGDYTLEVYEWTNIAGDPSHPSIGDTCFDVTVTGP